MSGNATYMQFLLSSQAVKPLLGLSEILPGVNSTGEQPFLGSSVDVKWILNISIISAIGAIQLILALLAAFFASKVVVFDDSAVSLTLLLKDIMDDMKLRGIDNLRRSNRKKDYNRSSGQYYRYGFMKARAGSEIDYSLTLKATCQSSQGDFPPGYYGKESLRPIFEQSKGSYDGLNYSSSQESTNLYGKAMYWPEVKGTP